MFTYAPVISSTYIVVSLVSSSFSVIQILFLQYLIDSVVEYSNSANAVSSVWLWGVLYVTSLIAAGVYRFSLAKMGRYLNRKLTKTLSPAVIRKFSSIEYRYYENSRFKDIVTRMTQNPQQTVHNTFFSVVTSTKSIINLVGIAIVFFAASVWIGLGAALIGIPMSILDFKNTKKQMDLLKEATTDHRKRDYLQGLFTDKHSAYEIKIFNAKNYLFQLWNLINEKIFSRYKKITKETLKTSTVVSTLKILYTAFTVISLAIGFINGNISLGVAVSIISSIGKLFSVLITTSYSTSSLVTRAIEIEYYREFMAFDERQEKTDKGMPPTGDIVFENVCFTYPDTTRKILHNLNLTIKSGEKVALVGANGSGKSTIVKLMCGLYKPDSGRIFIGGKDITTLSQNDISRVLSVVFQDFVPYQMTLRENVAFGDLTKLHDDKKLSEALELASAESLLQKGLDRNLGRLTEDGIDLSKGQWQRIAISRAFLSSADFIILDEPTASLDPVAESSMYESFVKVLRNRGAVIISHRLASARIADKIIVIDGGEVIGCGTHEELLKDNKLYSTMFQMQSAWYKPSVKG